MNKAKMLVLRKYCAGEVQMIKYNEPEVTNCVSAQRSEEPRMQKIFV